MYFFRLRWILQLLSWEGDNKERQKDEFVVLIALGGKKKKTKIEMSSQQAKLWVGSLDWSGMKLERKAAISKLRRGQGGEVCKQKRKKTN